MDPVRCWRAAIILIILATICLWVMITKVLAHDWYPVDCCGGYDCGPATMETISGATLASLNGGKFPPFVSTVTVTYTAGPQIGQMETVVVPDDFPRRESKDGRLHACVVGGKLRCLFIPPAM